MILAPAPSIHIHLRIGCNRCKSPSTIFQGLWSSALCETSSVYTMATASFSGRIVQGAHTSQFQVHQRIVSFRRKRGRCYAARMSPIVSAAKGRDSGNRRVIRGPCFVTRDNIDTDQIIPAEYLTLVPSKAEEYEKLGSYALIGLPTELYTKRFIEDGNMKTKYPVVIGGENFGCGSSREHAPVAMGAAGARVVVAQTYARIFFRNCVSTGELYPCETNVRLCDELETDEEVEVDMESDVLTVMRTGKQYPLTPIGDAGPVVDAGGIFEYARQTGMMKATAA